MEGQDILGKETWVTLKFKHQLLSVQNWLQKMNEFERKQLASGHDMR